jgi:trk system potassium uptake protein TrkH
VIKRAEWYRIVQAVAAVLLTVAVVYVLEQWLLPLAGVALLLLLAVVAFLTNFIGALIATMQKVSFIDGIFEVVSAFGTVGLSRGITADLNVFGQLLLMFLMFFGRIGPLTLGYLLARPKRNRVRAPSTEIPIG